jgi:uncharacterized protein involved in tellurium resistance
VISTEPSSTPKRTDLPYLRRRSRAELTLAGPQGSSNPALADFFASRGPRPRRRQSAAPPPDRLDLSAPAVAAASPPSVHRPPATAGTSPDLSGSAVRRRPIGTPAPTTTRPDDTSLDLSTSASPPAAPAGLSRASQPELAPPGRTLRPMARARAGIDTILSAKSPTVTLTRVQSGVGQLTFDAAASGSVGDLRLGCAYQFRSGHSSTVQHAGGNARGPRDSNRPVIIGSRDRFERITIDLRQSRELERLMLYAFSESAGQLNWDGTLIVTTFGGAKIELPLARPASRGVLVLMTLYNVRGEYVLRGEAEEINGSVRDACTAYGYDRITWLDGRTPVE